MAYERFAGPLGSSYSDEVLAGIHEQLQMLTYITGGANSDRGKNPIPEPRAIPRPWEANRPAAEQEDEEDASMSIDEFTAILQNRK